MVFTLMEKQSVVIVVERSFKERLQEPLSFAVQNIRSFISKSIEQRLGFLSVNTAVKSSDNIVLEIVDFVLLNVQVYIDANKKTNYNGFVPAIEVDNFTKRADRVQAMVEIVSFLSILAIVKRTLFTGQTNVSKEGFLRAINLVKL